jgi:hypothetical protein
MRRLTPRGDNPPPLRITRAGLEAIGVESEGEGQTAAPAEADTGTTSADAEAPVTYAERAATRAKKGRAAKSKARVSNAASADKPTPRAGTKQAQID